MIEFKQIHIPLHGYSIAADWYEGSSDEVLLVLIGHESSKAKYRDMVEALQSGTGTSALVIDYSGHGESPGNLDEISAAEHFLEVITAFDWIANNYSEKKINVMGTSYGGFMATQLTKYRTFPKLILRVPAIYPPDMFYDKTKIYKEHKYFQDFRNKSTDELVGYPPLKRASAFTGKTLVITHEFDDICPANETMAFAKAFGADTWEAKGFKHGFSESDVTEEQKHDYYMKIAEWLK